MSHAISELLRTAEVAEINAPIHEAEGNVEQAELCRAVARSCREAALALEAR